MTQKPRVTAGTLVNACFIASFIRWWSSGLVW
jgi:hypothetical protein